MDRLLTSLNYMLIGIQRNIMNISQLSCKLALMPAIMKKSAKIAWHNTMRQRACIHAGERCQNCGKHTSIVKGVIHHLTYPPDVYEQPVEQLIDDEICSWLCKICHSQEHIAYSFEESRHFMRRGGYCHHCNQLIFGGWDRGKSMGVNYCICKKCFKSIKMRKKLEDSGQMSMF